jgi:hypothetical protein
MGLVGQAGGRRRWLAGGRGVELGRQGTGTVRRVVVGPSGNFFFWPVHSLGCLSLSSCIDVDDDLTLRSDVGTDDVERTAARRGKVRAALGRDDVVGGGHGRFGKGGCPYRRARFWWAGTYLTCPSLLAPVGSNVPMISLFSAWMDQIMAQHQLGCSASIVQPISQCNALQEAGPGCGTHS